jgi:hypothetical protein
MKYRVAIGVLAVLTFHLCSYRYFPTRVAFVWDHHADYVDEVTLYETRFEAVRVLLPGHGTVGYRTDPPLVTGAESYFEYEALGNTWHMEAKKSYLLAQYALAPVIVDRTHDYPLAVANRKTGVSVVPTEGE